MTSIGKRFRTGVVATATTLALSLGLMNGFAPMPGGASSHREAPLTAADPQVDTTDFYAFVSPDNQNTVTLIANWIPFEEPAGGPNFYPFAENVHYDINIDNDGNGSKDIVYRWIFTNHLRNPTGTFLYNTGQVTSLDDADLNFYQTYDLLRLDIDTGETIVVANDAKVVPSNVGKASMPNYASLVQQGIYKWGPDRRTFAGQADDPFFLDLRVFDLLYGGDFSEAGDDTLAGFNVNSVALQVPKIDLAFQRMPNRFPKFGAWTTVSRPSTRVQTATGAQTFKRDFVQVSRLGMPLVNEVVVPTGFKDYFNASFPVNDAGSNAEAYVPLVNDPILPRIIKDVYGIPVPDSDKDEPGIQRDDLISVFLTGIDGLNKLNGPVRPSEMLRLNMSIVPCEQGSCEKHSDLGVIGGDVAGFPNGRRLADDVIDVSLQVVEGELIGNPNDLGDGVNSNDVAFRSSFPYVALPHSGSDPSPHPAKPLP